jgi:hypothetical protein
MLSKKTLLCISMTGLAIAIATPAFAKATTQPSVKARAATSAAGLSLRHHEERDRRGHHGGDNGHHGHEHDDDVDDDDHPASP